MEKKIAMTSISDVDFGVLDAESETNLAGYFVDTGVLSKLASGQRQFIVGRKGAGKTALFRLATPESLQVSVVVDIEFDQYPWEFHKQLKQAGMMAESAYEASWRFLLLLMMAEEWAKVRGSDFQKTAKELIHKILPDPGRGFWSSLISRLRNPSKITLPGGGVLGKVNANLGTIDLGKEDSAYAVGIMSSYLGALTSLAQTAYKSHPITIKVDRLDDGWDASPESQGLIIGELKAARAINQQFHEKGSAAPVITFLRSDIFEAVKFNDKNKMATNIERLDWTNDRLMDVLIRRITASLKVRPENAWAAAFSEVEMRQRAKPQSYFIRRTMGRPRDVIAFAIHCKDVAIERGHNIVETSDIYEAEDKYSQHLLNELSDELHKQLPRFDDLIDTLRDVGRMTFVSEDWIEAARRRTPGITDTEAREQLVVLYDASVIGVARVGGSKGGSRHMFSYMASLPRPDFSVRMQVHPGLKKGLQLKEGQMDDQDDVLGESGELFE